MTARKAEARRVQGDVEKRIRAELRAAGWTAGASDAAGSLGAMAIDLARTQDATRAARDKAALNRELRMTMGEFRAARAPSKGDAVDDDEAADELPGRGAGAADPDRQPDSNVRPFGRRRPAAG